MGTAMRVLMKETKLGPFQDRIASRFLFTLAVIPNHLNPLLQVNSETYAHVLFKHAVV
jgi:hypothetical protein